MMAIVVFRCGRISLEPPVSQGMKSGSRSCSSLTLIGIVFLIAFLTAHSASFHAMIFLP